MSRASSSALPSRGEATIGLLDNTILPALSLAKAGVTGLGVIGLEATVNGVFELLTMVSTMKANQKDLAALERNINVVVKNCEDTAAAIRTSGHAEVLTERLTKLVSNLEPIARQCKSNSGENKFKQFFNSKMNKDQIQGVQNTLTSLIRDFTFYGGISIEHIVADMKSEFDELKAREILQTVKSVAARYNAENTPNECMDGTRVDIINDIIAQLTSPPDATQRIVMLSGSAGSGKSTIAKSVASRLADHDKILAASFFFSRDYIDRREITGLPKTLARQFADHCPVFKRLLVDFLENDRTEILFADPKLQFHQLVVDLLAKLPITPTPWVICIDALDECGNDRGQVFLRWLSDSIDQIPKHIRFFLTGRPDVPSYIKLDKLQALIHPIILDQVDSMVVQQDISLYIGKALDGNTWTARYPWKIQAPEIEKITQRASGLFVFAATAVRYVLAGLPQTLPQKSVDFLLHGAPLTDLYDLYHRIVDHAIPIPAPRDERSQDSHNAAVKILSTVIQLLEPLGLQSLAVLFKMPVDDVRAILSPLSAVILLPEDLDNGVQIIHLSFREFMSSAIQETRPDLLCGTADQRYALASNLLENLNRELRFNICELPTSYLRNSEVPDLPWRMEKYIPQHLHYCCRFWANHLAETHWNSPLSHLAATFLQEKFLFWLEVLSLLGTVGGASHALSKFIRWVQEGSLRQFAMDGKRFIAFFSTPISQSAAHIYISALAMTPATAEIRKTYCLQFPRLLSITRGQMEKWPTTIASIEGHTDTVYSVAFSPDGKRIVSGSRDNTMCLWDAESGMAIGEPFEGHTDVVYSVAFSPDGKRIVSGSQDNTVRVWDVESGLAIGDPFKGHTDWVRSVAFSPDGKQIVSGSDDKTVRVWNAESGVAIGDPFKGHTNWVMTVAFSPDSKRIVSGSRDNTMCLWDGESGVAIGDPFKGHTNTVYSVAFSPHGKRIVSGSGDNTVRLWDMESGLAIGVPFEGHTNTVISVAFSPDGKRIVSGSTDRTVRVWEAESGVAIGNPFKGHTDWVRSVVFSPDGKQIVSGSDDKTVLVRDAESGVVIGDPFGGHSADVTSVAFSSDGRWIVSGSNDKTVRLWEEESGVAISDPFEGHTSIVTSVAFSPNGKRIVSGSEDNTVRLWDAESVVTIGEPFEGHTDDVNSVAFSPDGKQIVSGSDDKTVRVWDAESGMAIGDPFKGHTNTVTSVAFSPDGKQIVSGSYDVTVRVWDAESGVAIGDPFKGHTHWVMAVAFSPDGKWIVSGSQDDTVRVWDTERGVAIGEPFKGHNSSVNSVAFSPDGKRIVSGSEDNTVRLWDAESGVAISDPFEGHTKPVTSVAFSPNGKQIVSGSADNTVRVWDIESGMAIGEPFEAHTKSVTSVSFSPDSKQDSAVAHTRDPDIVSTSSTTAGIVQLRSRTRYYHYPLSLTSFTNQFSQLVK
ncbi:WD-REPEATS-REGION domain-containing protein [Mycena venus]|uniref:WD-REPEATS-REGION domain-containing protein n=1 Tax=Mycena venus TaxID=2733690 RepID=A0A8H7CYE7_9AGAR|nr:WD-REPEATS-REGION domain-containing protein [Mycena venus]